LFRALEMDSAFVHAAYRFAVINALVAPMTPFGTPPTGRDRRITWLYGLLWSQRHRLADDQRILLESITDSLNVLWHQQQLRPLERAVNLLPNSAEAWELLGDAYYHAGSLLGIVDWAERSKYSLGRALALDSTVALNAPGHLADLAFMEGDARAHERYARLAAGVVWAWENPTGSVTGVPRGVAYRRYQRAILSDKPEAVRASRVEYSHAWARGEDAGPDWAIRGMTLPPHELDSLLAQMATDAGTDSARRDVDEWLSHAAAMSGRPSRAMAPLRRSALPDTFLYYHTQNAWAEDDSVATEEIVALARTRPVHGVMQSHPAMCDAALSRLRRRDTTGVAAIIASEPTIDDTLDVISAWETKFRRGRAAQGALCALVARGVLASLTTSDMSRLLRADTLMRVMPLNYADWWNYDVALALARRGEFALAAAATRRHFHDTFPLQRLVLRLRQEGLWAALAGDTASAIKAYRHYLKWRSDPEPVLVPQRDSVLAELAALERGNQRWRWIARLRRPVDR
jgi:hypothetical protein